ncbi:MAG: TetR/AcrR family transcriptional regulator [Desulfobacteraceae bacterium]|jgi:TetR/AcrR family fatty acid metabolism transcriptional regulator
MSPKIVDKPLKKQEILKAAMRMFAQNGVVNTKMVDIAAAAGIGKGTIYEYFRSKEDIFAEAYSHIFMDTEKRIEEILESSVQPEEKLRELMKVSIEEFLVGDGGEFAGIMMSFWSEGIRNRNERIMEIIDLKKVYSEFRGMIAEILEEGIAKGQFREMDTHVTASVIIGAMDGILLQYIMDRNVFLPGRAIDALLAGFLNGIKNCYGGYYA